jgi:hypothetical protein
MEFLTGTGRYLGIPEIGYLHVSTSVQGTGCGTPVDLAIRAEAIGHRPAVPDVGQLAEVRQRGWIVTEVAASTLRPVVLDSAGDGRHHLASLASVEDDGLGEELQFLWELEPAARVH